MRLDQFGEPRNEMAFRKARSLKHEPRENAESPLSDQYPMH
jgi:hypothetical protein